MALTKSHRCALCGACTAVVLVVMGLVGVYVVFPKVAQGLMDHSVLSLDNSTLFLPSFTAPNGTLIVDMRMSNLGPVRNKIHEFKSTLSSGGYEFGYFEFPETVAKNSAQLHFDKTLIVTNGTAVQLLGISLLLQPTVDLEITGTVSVTAFGISANVKQNKKLFCVYLDGTPEPASPGVALSMKCTAEKPVSAVAVAPTLALPDCSTTACPAKCQCAEKQCAAEITSCLADSTCAGAQSCADACPCGDNTCLAGCALKHPSTKGISLLACVKKNCPASVRAMALPDCSTTSCPAKCQCAEKQCAAEITSCLADGTCAGAQSCADACPCGDNTCLAGCALKHPSTKGISLLACVKKNCPANAIGRFGLEPLYF